MQIQEQVILAPLTSWLIGGPADFFCRPRNIDELKKSQKFAQDEKLATTILGGGSNVLISDQGIRGLVICLKDLAGLEILEEKPRLQIAALAGTSKSELLKTFLKFKLAPALFLAGIPGEIGGGVVMNAGISENLCPREFVEIIDWVEVLKEDGTLLRLQKQEIEWSYRHSKGWQPGVICKVGLSWPNEPDLEILNRVREANRVRLSKQPLDLPSCGSVFKNPSGDQKAAQLIDACGLKGFSKGGAEVSKKHANFIVNVGDAKASEIWFVIEHVQKTVLQKTGVQLQSEVVRLGEW